MRVPAIIASEWGDREEGMEIERRTRAYEGNIFIIDTSLSHSRVLYSTAAALDECVKTFLVRPLLLNSIVMPFHRAWEFSEVSREQQKESL